MELRVGRLKEMKKFIFYEIPIICYKEENAGPNNNLYLWAYVPYSFSDKIFGHITLIYYNDKWIFSSPRYYFNY
jgi:hypothetical protein